MDTKKLDIHCHRFHCFQIFCIFHEENLKKEGSKMIQLVIFKTDLKIVEQKTAVEDAEGRSGDDLIRQLTKPVVGSTSGHLSPQ